ncbi:MAG TPA: GNAT family N-acetyltransferase [Candidatus Dormibacteraeota bacterium]|nr:GNAT family N-acetyltransferase [Candidatus Dormibacteraeota bacterium]
MGTGVVAAARSTGETELERIRHFIHQVMRGSASQVVSVAGGFAVLNAEFPDSYEHNCLVIGRLVDPSLLVQEADRVLGGAGLRHRAIELELEGPDESWLAEFRSCGYQVHPTLTMVLRKAPERRSQRSVEQVSYEELKPSIEAGWRRALPHLPEHSLRQLVERRSATSRACDVTHYVVRGPGGIVARCDLYRTPPIAQVENVETEPQWRNRGYATALVLAAVKSAQSSGCSLVFLIADAEDWPKQLYRRLGFEAVGGGCTLQRASQDAPDEGLILAAESS